VLQLNGMSGKTTPESLGPSSKSAVSQSADPILGTGMLSEPLQNPGTLTQYPRTYSFGVIASSLESLKTLWLQLLWSEQLGSIGDELALERVVLLGSKPAWMLTLRIPPQSGGMVIEVKNMLSSMNFVAASRSSTYCDGSIAIQWLWRPRAEQLCSEQYLYGLLLTSRQINGSQS